MTPELINAIAAFIGATAWPAIAVFFLVTFRGAIVKMLENVSSVTFGGLKAELSKVKGEKEQAERRADEALEAEQDLEIENEVLQERVSSAIEIDRGLKTTNDGGDGLAKMVERVTKYHTQLKNLFQNRKGEKLTTAQIRDIVKSSSDLKTVESWVLPSDHCSNHSNRASCKCAGTPDAVFERLKRGHYRVL
jgi:hypothetical protein